MAGSVTASTTRATSITTPASEGRRPATSVRKNR
jgi:hypothetical protein